VVEAWTSDTTTCWGRSGDRAQMSGKRDTPDIHPQSRFVETGRGVDNPIDFRENPPVATSRVWG
jgi:hypothetical protein